ncbi:hypothetical protein [Methanobacterium aggregans]|uniref:hypothetical protein n=1 Tax=Methanobacterium aggregans TaxID=1615586 RepID=UPI001AE581E1|nr:hypothetical protein [Methanobacterium aggregans]MBP2045000.1 hypothetical protein [Methanobacterium aggregans]
MKESKKDRVNKEKELSSQLEKQLSPARAVVRIIIGFFALVIWILIGVSPTILFSSSIQEFIGVTSFFYRNPILFLLVAFINIFLGVIVYFIGIFWWAAFHILWSIRWFYGFKRYHKLKKSSP